MTTQTTAVTVTERAIVAIGGSKYETDLRALAAKSADITSITNKAGLDQCHAHRVAIKRERIEIGRKASAATEDAKQFVASVSARAKSLVALLATEESRLGDLQESYVSEQERIKREAKQREKERVDGIMARIEEIRNAPVVAATATAHECDLLLLNLDRYKVDDTFSEFQGRAAVALVDAKAGVAAILDAKISAAEEAARIKAEQEAAAAAHAAEVAEFERMKAEADEQRRQEQAKEREAADEREAKRRAAIAEERAKEKAEQDERDRIAAEASKAEADRIAVERAKLAEEQAKFEAERAAILAGIEAERRRVADEEAQAAAIKKAGEDAIAAHQAEEKRKADEAESARRAVTSAIRQRIDAAMNCLDDYELGMVAEFAESLAMHPGEEKSA